MIKAREYANAKICVVDRKTGAVEDPLKTRPREIPDLLYKLFNRPNVLQSKWEFLQQGKIMEEVAGNAFIYGNSASGKIDAKNLAALWNVWPQCMEYKLSGNYFEATRVEDVIAGWKFKAGDYEKAWQPHEIMHKNKPNTEIYDGLIFGRSPAQSLVRPLSNIALAYESRNVVMANQGMSAIISAQLDKDGLLPLLPDEDDPTAKALKNFGNLHGQNRMWVSPYPVNVTPMNQNVQALGLFEEIRDDAAVVANAYGIPKILLELAIKGATYENQEASVRRLYQGTLIPEAEDYFIALNYFLNLHDTPWVVIPSFAHVACLQESEEQKEGTRKTRAERMMAEISAQVRTRDEYRADMGMEPLPKVEPEGGKPEGQDTATLQAQAQLRGSVGGVQGILGIQSSVAAGTTPYDAALSILVIVYGFNEQDAKSLLGTPEPIEVVSTSQPAIGTGEEVDADETDEPMEAEEDITETETENN